MPSILNLSRASASQTPGRSILASALLVLVPVMIVFAVPQPCAAQPAWTAQKTYYSTTNPKNSHPVEKPYLPTNAGKIPKYQAQKGSSLYIGTSNLFRDIRFAKNCAITFKGNGHTKLKFKRATGYMITGQQLCSTAQAVQPIVVGSSSWTVFLDPQPDYECLEFEVTAAVNLDLTVTVLTQCGIPVNRAHNFAMWDQAIGIADEMYDPASFSEMYVFPSSVAVDDTVAPSITVPDGSGTWQSEFVYMTPDGDPRPLGGVRFFTSDGPGIAPEANISWDLTMVAESDDTYEEFVRDAYSGAVTYFTVRSSTSPVIIPEGNCPGPMTFQISELTPRGRTAITYGLLVGQTNIPMCPGVTLEFAGAQLAALELADPTGHLTFPANIPNAGCGRVLIQAVDLETCRVSNDIGI